MARHFNIELSADSIGAVDTSYGELDLKLDLSTSQLNKNVETLVGEMLDSDKVELIKTIFKELDDGDQKDVLRTLFGEDEFDDVPDYHHQGMGCGLEDRNITDRYDAMAHGWECGVDKTVEAANGWLAEKLGR